MNFSRPFLLGMLALGLPVGIAAALEPEPAAVNQLPERTLTVAPEVTPALPAPFAAPMVPEGGSGARYSGFAGGVGFYLLQPYFESNPAYHILVENHDVKPTGIAVDRVDVSHHLEVSPLLWLAYANEDGLGARARGWYFRQGSNQVVNLPPFAGRFGVLRPPIVPVPVIFVSSGTLVTATSAAPLGLQAFGDTLSLMHGPEATSFAITTKLEVEVLDLEVFQDLRAGSWDFLCSGGLRLARIAQTYNAYDAQSTSAAELRSLLSSYNFQGVGPTIAVEARRPLGGTGLTAFGTARGSLVIGSAQQNASFGGQELRNDDPNPQFATQHRERGLPIAELELGVEYGLTFGPSRVFGQIAMVGQDWFGAGNASRSAVQTPPNSPNPVSGGSAVDSDIAFFGLSFRIGVNY